MLIHSQNLKDNQAYFLLTQTVIPRPIGWVLSDNGDKTYNFAPFSFFNAVCGNPPMVILSIGWKSEEEKKDTWVNIDVRSNFVVHVPSSNEAETVVGTAATLKFGESEVDALKLKLIHDEGMPLPRVVGPKAVFYCVRTQILELGHDPQGLIIGEVKHFWLDDSIVSTHNDRLTIDYQKFDPLARLGGNAYSKLGNIWDVVRPK